MTLGPETDAVAFIECLRRESGANHPDEVWQAVLSAAKTLSLSPEHWRALWVESQKVKGVLTDTPAAMWFPDEDALESSQLAAWMRKRGDLDFAAFRAWSLAHRDQFWTAAASRLGIVFDKPATTTLIDEFRGTRAQWFPGARLNIARSCFLAPDDSIAIVSQRPGNTLRHWTVSALRDEVNQIVGAIRAAGFEAGDALGVVLPLTPTTVALYLGILAAGCRVVSIADSFAPPEIGSRLRIASARAVFTCDVQVRGGKTLPLGQRVQQATDLPAIVIADAPGSDANSRSLRSELGSDPLPPTFPSLAIDLRPNDRSWSDFLAAGSFDSAWHSAESTEIINVLFSSGTTGDPKAIPWTHLTPLKCAVDGLVHQDIRPGHVCCWPTSLGWMMGPWLIFATLINRGTIALFEDAPMGAGFGQFVEDAQVNMLGVVPTIVRAWRESRAMEGFDWSRIHCFSSTGESSRADDMFYLASLAGMRPVIEYCGGTEIGGGYISSTLLLPNVPAAFSIPAAGIDFVILDEAGQPTDQGELFIIPPCVGLSTSLLNRDHFATYYADTPPCPPGGTASGAAQNKKSPPRPVFGERGPGGEGPAAGSEPALNLAESAPRYDSPFALPILRRHGDHFRRLPGNYFCAGGRVDDTMNLGGIKTSSAELERVLNQVPGVHETAAVAWSGSGGPEELHVFFVPVRGMGFQPVVPGGAGLQRATVSETAALLAAMNARLKSDLNPLFKVRAIHPVDHLPRTASNKVMRRLLRDKLKSVS